ncbi:MAG: hypothetical protein E7162_02355 [Firmicutes bacterium]|nr:hypothetical protein [Bacillota bacterium]
MENKNKKKTILLVMLFLGIVLVVVGLILNGTKPKDNISSKDQEKDEDYVKDDDYNKDINLNSKLIYDKEVKIYIDSVNVSSDNLTIGISIKNTSNQDITIYNQDIYIDNHLVSGNIFLEVEKGKTEKDEISVYDPLIRLGNVTTVNTLEIGFCVEDINGDTLYDIEPIKVSIDDKSNTINVQGEELYNKDGIVIKYITNETDFISTNFYFYIENNTSKDLLIYSEGVTINNKNVSSNLNCDIKSGKKNLTLMMVGDTEYSGEPIESMQLKIFFLDNNEYKIIGNAILNKK